VAGASAREAYRRRSERAEAQTRAKHRWTGALRVAGSKDQQHVASWAQGARGEEMVGEHLDRARRRGIEVLHDRRIPGSSANIDHLVIAPNGIWVVDAKRYRSGKLQRRDVGGLFKTDVRLKVGGRDQSKLVAGMLKQMDLVATVLVDSGFGRVPVHGALCFVEVETDLFARPFTIDGVSITWRKHLVKPMLTPVLFGPETRMELTHLLAERFPFMQRGRRFRKIS
jgi:hypothetical protein